MSTVHSGPPRDPCPHHMFNLGNNSISKELTTILNTSITYAILPEVWKNAEVKPLLKKTPQTQQNSKPTSQSPCSPFHQKSWRKQLTSNSPITWKPTNSWTPPNQDSAKITARKLLWSQLPRTSGLSLTRERPQPWSSSYSAAFDNVSHYTDLQGLQQMEIQGKPLNGLHPFSPVEPRKSTSRLSPQAQRKSSAASDKGQLSAPPFSTHACPAVHPCHSLWDEHYILRGWHSAHPIPVLRPHHHQIKLSQVQDQWCQLHAELPQTQDWQNWGTPLREQYLPLELLLVATPTWPLTHTHRTHKEPRHHTPQQAHDEEAEKLCLVMFPHSTHAEENIHMAPYQH